LTDR